MVAVDDVFASISKSSGLPCLAIPTSLECLLSANAERWVGGSRNFGGSQMKALSDCYLYTFVDTAYLRGRAPEIVAQQLCDGGSDLIQLRAKGSSIAEIRAMAEKILPITSRAGVCLIIN